MQVRPGAEPQVSCIVLCYSNEDPLPTVIPSLQAQTVAGGLETLLADNGSKDRSVEAARSPGARVVEVG